MIHCPVSVSLQTLLLSPFHVQKLMLRLNWGASDQARDTFSKQSSRIELHDSTGIQKGLTVRLCINLVFLGLYENRLVGRN